MQDGSRKTFDLDTTVKSEARRRKARIVKMVEQGLDPESEFMVKVGGDTFKVYATQVHQERVALGVVSARDEMQRLRDYVFDVIGHMALADIRPSHVRDVLRDAIMKGRSTQTVKHIRNAMYKVFRAAVVDELVTENVVEKVDPPERREVKKQRISLNDEEFERLWQYLVDRCDQEEERAHADDLPYHLKTSRSQAAADKWTPHVMACLAAGGDHISYAREHGLRSDELLTWIRKAKAEGVKAKAAAVAGLTPARELLTMSACARILGGMRTSDVNRWDYLMLDVPLFTKAVIPRGKTMKPHPLDIPEPLQPFLRDWWERSGRPTSGPVFPVIRGKRRGQRKKERGVSYAERLRDACKAARLTRPELYVETDYTLPVDFHSLRGAFVTSGRKAGVAPEIVMKLAAHSSREVHELYVKDDPTFQRIPSSMIPTLPAPPQKGALIVDRSGPSRSVTALGTMAQAQRELPRATVDSNHWPSAPEAVDLDPDGPIGPQIWARSDGSEGPEGAAAGLQGPANRTIVPWRPDRSGAGDRGDHVAPRGPSCQPDEPVATRIPDPHAGVAANLEHALHLSLTGDPAHEPEVVRLLAESGVALGGLTDRDLSVIVGDAGLDVIEAGGVA